MQRGASKHTLQAERSGAQLAVILRGVRNVAAENDDRRRSHFIIGGQTGAVLQREQQQPASDRQPKNDQSSERANGDRPPCGTMPALEPNAEEANPDEIGRRHDHGRQDGA